jgi:hypothetical protein
VSGAGFRTHRLAASIGVPRKRVGLASVELMVGIAQLVERRVVVANVAGSSPVTHPKVLLAQITLTTGVNLRLGLISSYAMKVDARK